MASVTPGDSDDGGDCRPRLLRCCVSAAAAALANESGEAKETEMGRSRSCVPAAWAWVGGGGCGVRRPAVADKEDEEEEGGTTAAVRRDWCWMALPPLAEEEPLLGVEERPPSVWLLVGSIQ